MPFFERIYPLREGGRGFLGEDVVEDVERFEGGCAGVVDGVVFEELLEDAGADLAVELQGADVGKVDAAKTRGPHGIIAAQVIIVGRLGGGEGARLHIEIHAWGEACGVGLYAREREERGEERDVKVGHTLLKTVEQAERFEQIVPEGFVGHRGAQEPVEKLPDKEGEQSLHRVEVKIAPHFGESEVAQTLKFGISFEIDIGLYDGERLEACLAEARAFPGADRGEE